MGRSRGPCPAENRVVMITSRLNKKKKKRIHGGQFSVFTPILLRGLSTASEIASSASILGQISLTAPTTGTRNRDFSDL